jgi:hypothetical protein
VSVSFRAETQEFQFRVVEFCKMYSIGFRNSLPESPPPWARKNELELSEMSKNPPGIEFFGEFAGATLDR